MGSIPKIESFPLTGYDRYSFVLLSGLYCDDTTIEMVLPNELWMSLVERVMCDQPKVLPELVRTNRLLNQTIRSMTYRPDETKSLDAIVADLDVIWPIFGPMDRIELPDRLVQLFIQDPLELFARTRLGTRPLFRLIIRRMVELGWDGKISACNRRIGLLRLYLNHPDTNLVLGGEALKALIDLKIGINDGYETGHTILYQAISKGQTEIALALIEAGARVNTQIATSGRTPLIMAVKKGQTEVVKTLLRAGADVQTLDVNNYPAGYYARYVTYNQAIIELIHAAART